MRNEDFLLSGFQCKQIVEGFEYDNFFKLKNSGLIHSNDFNPIYNFEYYQYVDLEHLTETIDYRITQLIITTLFEDPKLSSSFRTKNIVETNYTSENITNVWEELISKHCHKHYCELIENIIENDDDILLNEDELRNKMIDKFKKENPDLYATL